MKAMPKDMDKYKALHKKTLANPAKPKTNIGDPQKPPSSKNPKGRHSTTSGQNGDQRSTTGGQNGAHTARASTTETTSGANLPTLAKGTPRSNEPPSQDTHNLAATNNGAPLTSGRPPPPYPNHQRRPS